MLLYCLALLPQEVLDIQNNLYQVGGDGGLSPDNLCLPQQPSPATRKHPLAAPSGNHMPDTGQEAEDRETSRKQTLPTRCSSLG